MSAVGQIERKTQARVVALFRDTLGYDYLGNWIDRDSNANIEPELLRAWLQKRGVDEVLITRTLYVLEKAAVTQARASTIVTARSTTCCATA